MNDEDIKKNGRVLTIVVVAMFGYLFAMHYANADMIVIDRAGNSATLYDKPCTDGKVLAFITMKGARGDEFRAGLMLYQGKTYEACWAASQDGHVYIVDSAGDITRVPMEAFVRVTGV